VLVLVVRAVASITFSLFDLLNLLEAVGDIRILLEFFKELARRWMIIIVVLSSGTSQVLTLARRVYIIDIVLLHK